MKPGDRYISSEHIWIDRETVTIVAINRTMQKVTYRSDVWDADSTAPIDLFLEAYEPLPPKAETLRPVCACAVLDLLVQGCQCGYIDWERLQRGR